MVPNNIKVFQSMKNKGQLTTEKNIKYQKNKTDSQIKTD